MSKLSLDPQQEVLNVGGLEGFSLNAEPPTSEQTKHTDYPQANQINNNKEFLGGQEHQKEIQKLL